MSEPEKTGSVTISTPDGVIVATAVKAVGDWELEVLGNRFGSEVDKDTDDQYFSDQTNLHNDRFPNPLVHYYHGLTPLGHPDGDPEIIGEVKGIERRNDGVWYRVVLDKASEYARRVWEAAKDGIARASSGSISHLVRDAVDGEILNWPVVELSLFDAVGKRQPADKYAVALPVAKSFYKSAGVSMPELPEGADKSEAKPKGAKRAGGAEPKREPTESNLKKGQTPTEENPMSDKDETNTSADVDEQIAAALKAEREKVAAEAKAEEERQAAIDEAVKAEKEKWEKENAKDNRLPTGGKAPVVAKYADTYKFDNLDIGEHALAVQTYQSLKAHRNSRGVTNIPDISDAAVRALALKAESEAEKDDKIARVALGRLSAKLAQSGKAFKSDEINYSTLTSYGDEWVGVLYSRNLWEKVRANTWVLNELQSRGDSGTIPDGYESETIPLESTDPVWYKVAQATDTNATTGRPDATITSSRVGTAQKSITVAKMGCRSLFSGELSEDSLIRWAPNAMRQMGISGGEMFDHAVIDGDTETSASTNINDIAGTPAGTEVFMLVDGFRKLALVTNTANSRDGGALDDEDFLETLKLMGTGGMNADPEKVDFLLDAPTYWKALTLATLKTRDVNSQMTIEDGVLTRIWGYPVKKSHFMNYAGVLLGTVTTAAYQLKSNTAGKVDQDTEANNTKGSFLAVRWDQWAFRWKRQMTMEVDRWPEADTNQIVAMARWGLAYRDTDASAISYNLTV